ncbi:MAG: signal recognition particle-docking protein FtsY [Deltaproteobacteria bacterium]|nr:signal recognition particle-docking protein FtsY [Deltaproteobacteria bacterium]
MTAGRHAGTPLAGEAAPRPVPGKKPADRRVREREPREELAPARKPGAAPARPAPDEEAPAEEEGPEAPKDEERAPATGEAEEEEEERELAPETVQPEEAKPPPAPPPRRPRDVAGLRKGLAKVREPEGLFGRLKILFGGKKEIEPAVAEQIEEILLTSDVGVKTTQALLAEVRDGLERRELREPDRVWEVLHRRAIELVRLGGGPLRQHGKPTVVLLVGVNGTGKTTTIGKLATKAADQDRKVLLVAGDTFRAAAVEQLQIWGERVGCEVYCGQGGADPAAVVFDAVKRAVETGVDLVLVDTAGRLHTKTNLMDELKKIVRTAGKALDGAPHETLLVVDATNGQNALQQAQMFKEALSLSGIVLTKLDGTAKGGTALAICAEHGLPVRYVGVGERPEDLRDFDAEEFVEAMLGRDEQEQEAAA